MNIIEQEKRYRSITVDKVTQPPNAVLRALENAVTVYDMQYVRSCYNSTESLVVNTYVNHIYLLIKQTDTN